ncbi:MAG: alpha/beta hydrolase fold protein [Moraxellaceae bacterium]|jgi:pimeloyl-ACP methyl ester carboxylesterase|nr:alpha/beta hydrolase fold protein [Moraxellaceae bacterium]
MPSSHSRNDRAPQALAGFSGMAAAYRRNAVVDVAAAEFQRRLVRWRPRADVVWTALRRLSPALTGMARRHSWILDHRLVFIEGGCRQGEPVVLLHGFGSSKENWLTLAPLIGRRYRVIAPDLPGFGESGFNRNVRYGLAEQAERIARFIDRHVGEQVHLVGSSMGGGVAGFVAARHPELLRSVTLMNAAGIPGGRPSFFEQAVVSGRNELIPRTLGETVRLASLVLSRGGRLRALAAPLLHAELAHRYHVNHRLFHDILDVDVEPAHEFARIRVPAHVLWGAQDRVLDASSAEAMARVIPGSTHTVLPGVGHLPMLEAPFMTARTLQAFWTTHMPRPLPAGDKHRRKPS